VCAVQSDGTNRDAVSYLQPLYACMLPLVSQPAHHRKFKYSAHMMQHDGDDGRSSRDLHIYERRKEDLVSLARLIPFLLRSQIVISFKVLSDITWSLIMSA
jgi:hypothetical protein